jgi:hypothetical protein
VQRQQHGPLERLDPDIPQCERLVLREPARDRLIDHEDAERRAERGDRRGHEQRARCRASLAPRKLHRSWMPSPGIERNHDRENLVELRPEPTYRCVAADERHTRMRPLLVALIVRPARSNGIAARSACRCSARQGDHR